VSVRNPLKDKVAIVGIGFTEYGRHLQRTPLSLGLEASIKAIEDAGIPKEEIDGICGSGGSTFGVGGRELPGHGGGSRYSRADLVHELGLGSEPRQCGPRGLQWSVRHRPARELGQRERRVVLGGTERSVPDASRRAVRRRSRHVADGLKPRLRHHCVW
jgi:hypothetical protein